MSHDHSEPVAVEYLTPRRLAYVGPASATLARLIADQQLVAAQTVALGLNTWESSRHPHQLTVFRRAPRHRKPGPAN